MEEELLEEVIEEQNDEVVEEIVGIQEVELSVDQLNKFIELHNDNKQFNSDMAWLFVGLFLGYVFIRGLLTHWKS